MDKLHSQSTRLTNFHVCPTCAPTRGSLMTGRYAHTTGIWHTVMGRSILRSDETTLANVFSNTGYKTGFFGKWHLGDNYPYRPQDRGFKEVLAHAGGGITQSPDYWNNDYFDDTYFHNGQPKKYTGYCTDIWFDNAVKFIEQNKSKPFFCYIATNAPHGPFNVPQKYIDMYKDDPDVPNPNFYGMITNVDENLGQLQNKLEKLNLIDNTIFIFMTDNGTAAGYQKGKGFNANMRGTKGSHYDGGHRVPFFIRYPDGNIQPARDIDHLTAHIDIMPTLIEMCDLSSKRNFPLDGKSLLPLLTEQNPDWPDRAIITDSQRLEHPAKWRRCAVMTQQYRLIDGKELYDIKADPSQKTDIAKANPAVVEQLKNEYEKWWAKTSERFDEYCNIIIGSDHENPTRLVAHDWHSIGNNQNLLPWHQNNIRNAMQTDGFWAVEIERNGTYQFELQRWPKEANAPLNASLPPTEKVPGNFNFPKGKPLNITTAHLKIANIDQTIEVNPNEHAATFTVKLTKGKTKLHAQFTDDKQNTFGAYYVYAKCL